MIDKTQTGVTFFDERYGGTYRHRPMIVCGRSGAGKTIFALQFAMQGILMDERCLLLSAWRANDLLIFAESVGFPIAQAVDAGRLTVLEYNQYVPGRDKEWNIVLPPDGFIQLEEVIRTQAVQRVVLDTVLPWVCIREHQRLDEHLFSFVRAFDRMQVTSVFTLPKPVSPLSFRIKNTLENLVPVSITLSREPAHSTPAFIVSKYLGENRLAGGTPYHIVKGSGIVKLEPTQAASAPSFASTPAPPTPVPTPVPPPVPESTPAFSPESANKEEPKGPVDRNIRFSSIMPGLDRIVPIPERRKVNRPF